MSLAAAGSYAEATTNICTWSCVPPSVWGCALTVGFALTGPFDQLSKQVFFFAVPTCGWAPFAVDPLEVLKSTFG